uniref:MAGE domain-containing protein n=1 Tax=Rousettus aegyptiacus TaxID=9407 RepID=A0A7J8EJT5_ROUAE|nr:hypothetical protein HJG63_012492 [Rousettus aegyptiacus]
MAEGSFRMESESFNAEDMDEGSDEVREEEMVEGNDYEEFGAFGGYGTFTSFDMRLLRAFGSLGPGFRILSNEPWELENPTLAQTLVEAFQLDPETLANEAAAHAANVARAAASNRAARAAAAAARAAYNRVVASHLLATDQASGEDTQPTTFVATEAQGAATPETTLASPHSSQMPVNSEMAASGVPATSSQPQPTSQAQEEVASEGPSTACTFSQAPCTSEVDATRPKTAFLGQKDVFDFGQPAGVSGMAFPRPKRPAPTQEAAAEGPSAASGVPQAAVSSGEGAATRPKTTKSLSLLLVILGVIFMNGNRASEAVLWEALRKMGLRPGMRHPFLGDLRKLITDDFVKQKYLEYKKIPNSSPSEYEFLWGLRACHETSKMRVLRFIAQNQNRDPQEWKAHFLEAVDDAFKTMDVDMAEEHARAQMRAQMNIGDEALIGRWSWDDIQVELLSWDEDGDFGDAWARIPFAFWARYHQYILNSNRANGRATWRAGISGGTDGGTNTTVLDGPSTSSTIRTRNAARTSASFFSWIQ